VLKPSSFNYLSANPPISQQIGDTLIWNNVNINIFQQKSFDIDWNIPANIALGTSYSIHAWIEPIASDTTPNNNHTVFNGTVTGSYDPNDKAVDKETIDPIMYNQELKFMIRFQNTGTDTAFNIMIRDTISNHLDIRTFRVLGASHNYHYLLREQGLLEVFFQNILLPDSHVNEPKSHGFIQYAIKPKAGLPIGTEITNTAYIYFDYNLPIVTNTTKTSIQTVSRNTQNTIDADIYPNPNNGKIRIRIGSGKEAKLIIQDIQGKTWIEKFVYSGEEVELKELSSGMYLAIIETPEGIKRIKLIKE
jgi:uncharacterized repeat protein (TIGR01451 family)